jgi:hypothetical protein
MFQYPQNLTTTLAHLTTRPLCCTYYSCLESSASVLNGPGLLRYLSASVRNGPFLSEILTNFIKISPFTNSFARYRLQCYMYTPAMPKSTPYLYRDTLEKLAAEPPTSKTALLCSLLFEIEGALRSGKTHKQIWQRLSDAGLDISCETFCRLIRRARKKRRHIRGAGREKCRSPGAARPKNCDRRGTRSSSQSPKSRSVQAWFSLSRHRKFGCPGAWKKGIP